MNLNLKELEKQFHADGFLLGMQALEAGLGKDVLNKSVQNLHSMVDEVIDAFLIFAEQHKQSPDCKKNCSWCCYQPVFALSYELDNLNDFISKNFTVSEKEQINARADAKRKILIDLKGNALLHFKFPCPLLQDGSCMAYNARPVACRIYLSSEVKSCKIFFHDPENVEAVPALMDFPMRMGRMINEGFSAALKSSGVEIEELRIEEGLGNVTL